MSVKFKTPVSMEVTKEQYENDLKEQLKELGYDSEYYCGDDHSPLYTYLITRFANKNKSVGFNQKELGHFIDYYNPKLFLALAGMTEGDTPIVGEWLRQNSFRFQVKSVCADWNCKDTGAVDINNPTGNGQYFKLTKEELINHFAKASTPKLSKPTPVEEWSVGTYFLITEEGFQGADQNLKHPLSPKGTVCEITYEWSDDTTAVKEMTYVIPRNVGKWFAAKIEAEQYWESMLSKTPISTEPTFEEVCAKYPIGTKYKCAAAIAVHTVDNTDDYQCYLDPTYIHRGVGLGCKGWIYYEGKYAEIITEEPVVKEEVYNHKPISNNQLEAIVCGARGNSPVEWELPKMYIGGVDTAMDIATPDISSVEDYIKKKKVKKKVLDLETKKIEKVNI